MYICIHVYIYCTLLTSSNAKYLPTILTYMYICIYVYMYILHVSEDSQPLARAAEVDLICGPSRAQKLQITPYYSWWLDDSTLPRITSHSSTWLTIRFPTRPTPNYTVYSWDMTPWDMTPYYPTLLHVTLHNWPWRFQTTVLYCGHCHISTWPHITSNSSTLQTVRFPTRPTSKYTDCSILWDMTPYYFTLLYWPLRSQTIVLCCGNCSNMWPKQSPN